jgi:hypothetical protein
MGKMPAVDWKQWAVSSPIWLREDIEVIFKNFLGKKWRDALNIAAAETSGWHGNPAPLEPKRPPHLLGRQGA